MDCSTQRDDLVVALGYPFMYDLDDQEFAALGVAARALGESEAYVSVIEGYDEGEILRSDLHWRISLEMDPYPGMSSTGWPHICENAIYSTKGNWAVKIASASYVVVAGPSEFVALLEKSVDRFSTARLRQLLNDWPSGPGEYHWIEPCLKVVLGSQQARELLQGRPKRKS
ncbi:MAG: hypothetical protein AB7J35_14885 [Dehalococcoidia bacterium]